MAVAILDTHRIVRRLTDAGASERLAETVTDVLRETRELDLSQLATKADIALLRADFDALRGETRADFDALRAETKADIALLRADIDALRASTRADLAEAKSDLRREIAETKAELIKWVVGVGSAQVAALIGAMIAIVRFLPGGEP